MICFSGRNMVHVTPQIKGRKFVFTDQDRSGAGERAAVETRLPLCMSPAQDEDANGCQLDRTLGLIMSLTFGFNTARDLFEKLERESAHCISDTFARRATVRSANKIESCMVALFSAASDSKNRGSSSD